MVSTEAVPVNPAVAREDVFQRHPEFGHADSVITYLITGTRWLATSLSAATAAAKGKRCRLVVLLLWRALALFVVSKGATESPELNSGTCFRGLGAGVFLDSLNRLDPALTRILSGV